MLWSARQRLLRAGYNVIGAWLSPISDAVLKEEGGDKDRQLSAAFRLRVAELSVCSDEFVSVGTFDISSEKPQTHRTIIANLQETLAKNLSGSLDGRRPRVFYVCGTDVAKALA